MAEANNHGGRREGSGRPKGSLGRRSVEAIAEVAERFPEWSPLMHLAAVANDTTLDTEIRLDAAKAAAPFCHAKLRPVVADVDDLIDLERRLEQVRSEARLQAFSKHPHLDGLADRLARAGMRADEDMAERLALSLRARRAEEIDLVPVPAKVVAPPPSPPVLAAAGGDWEQPLPAPTPPPPSPAGFQNEDYAKAPGSILAARNDPAPTYQTISRAADQWRFDGDYSAGTAATDYNPLKD